MPNSNSVRLLCRRRVATLRPRHPAAREFEQWLVGVVEENLAGGRFRRFTAHRKCKSSLELAEYIDQVIRYADQEYARIRALEQGEAAAWNGLRDVLFQRAKALVRRFNETAVATAALDFAQQTCAIIFEERYPCDVAFDAWATIILKNLIVAHYTRSPNPLNHPTQLDSLDMPKSRSDNPTPLGERIAAANSLAPFEKIENEMVLRDAIAQLASPVQRQLIQWSFLEERDDDQIAQDLGKSKQAIYNLRRRALTRLHEILAKPARKKRALKSIR